MFRWLFGGKRQSESSPEKQPEPPIVKELRDMLRELDPARYPSREQAHARYKGMCDELRACLGPYPSLGVLQSVAFEHLLFRCVEIDEQDKLAAVEREVENDTIKDPVNTLLRSALYCHRLRNHPSARGSVRSVREIGDVALHMINHYTREFART